MLLLHVIFFFFVAPYLELAHDVPARTEVVEISPQQLQQLKKKIMRDRQLNPLMKQELHEEYKSKEAPKDAQMMAPFNQVVPKQKVAGAQPDKPMDGGGGARAKPEAKKLDLAKLGLGTKVPKPQAQPQEASPEGPQGPPGLYRPVGRDDPNLEKSNQNLLNAAESKFYSFFVRLEEPIIHNWFFLLRNFDRQIQGEMSAHGVKEGAELPITVEFVLDRQGNFRSIDVIESSAIPTLDRVTRDAVRKLGSLPNPPPDLFEGGQYYTRRLRFMVHVTSAPMINTRPDLAW
ncbi:MAG: TonB family protein [Deltaproteobacteria bacterium]|nr:TonB family protein [Deltaproteobacteria bacterium]